MSKSLKLTEEQRDSDIGRSLVATTLQITASGTLDRSGLISLKQWLRTHESLDWANVVVLKGVFGRAIADGKITQYEVHEIYDTLLMVMPLTEREILRGARQKYLAEKRKGEKAERDQAKEAAKQERERNRPLWDGTFMVAGTKHDGRSWYLSHVKEGDAIILCRIPTNQFDRHAIGVFTEDMKQIGYVPRVQAYDEDEEVASELSPLLDNGGKYNACVSKILDRAKPPIPIVAAQIYNKDAAVSAREHTIYTPPPPALSVLFGFALHSLVFAFRGVLLVLAALGLGCYQGIIGGARNIDAFCWRITGEEYLLLYRFIQVLYVAVPVVVVGLVLWVAF